MIGRYEKKVSQLREENVNLKVKHKDIQDILSNSCLILQKLLKYLSSEKVINQNFEGTDSEKFIFNISSDIKKNISQI